MSKRSPRCSYCGVVGHNRLGCAVIKQDAAAGSKYAQEVVERLKIKRCSFCHGTDHISSTCEEKYQKQLLAAELNWGCLNAMANIVRNKKIAKGAFLYAPVQHRYTYVPSLYENGKPNYFMANIIIENLEFDKYRVEDEQTGHFTYSTLSEPEEATRLSRLYFLPGFASEVNSLGPEFANCVREWRRINRSRTWLDEGRRLSMELTQVLVEAPQEEVDRTVNEILAEKPLILDYPDRASYARAVRKMKKEAKINED